MLNIFFILLLLPIQTQYNWNFEFEKEGIKVYTAQTDLSDFKTFKGEITVNASVEDIMNVLIDIPNFSNWCYKTKNTKLLKTESNKTFFYFQSETPPMVKKREAYYCNEIISISEEGATITMKAIKSDKKVPKGFVRIPMSDGVWKLTRKPNGETHILFRVTAEPGGDIPPWLANISATESPYVTLRNLRSIVEKE